MSERAHCPPPPPAKIEPVGRPEALSTGLPGASTILLALGNPLRGDDGVGYAVLERLASILSIPQPALMLKYGTAGLMDALFDPKPHRLIVVDAAEIGRAPGEWYRFTLQEAILMPPDPESSGFLHEVRLNEALDLVEALGLPTPQVIIYGVQPFNLGWSPGLSETVEKAVPEICQSILMETRNRISWKGCGEMSKILIIDDDPDIVLAVRMALENAGHQVIDAGSGAEGIEKIKAESPDLIILDVMMETHTEGFQLALKLRNPDPASEYAKFSKIPILMLTAIHSTTPLRFEPDVDYLPVELFVDKPIDPQELIGKVEMILSREHA